CRKVTCGLIGEQFQRLQSLVCDMTRRDSAHRAGAKEPADARPSGLVSARHTQLQSSEDLLRNADMVHLTLITAANCSPTLRLLDVHNSFGLKDAALQAVSTQCPLLETLDIGGCDKLTDLTLVAIARGCPQMRALFVRDCHRMTTAGVKAVVASCPKLQVLDLRNCIEISDGAIQAMAAPRTEGYLGLRCLDVSGCAQLTDASLRSLAQISPRSLEALYPGKRLGAGEIGRAPKVHASTRKKGENGIVGRTPNARASREIKGGGEKMQAERPRQPGIKGKKRKSIKMMKARLMVARMSEAYAS
ncbi:hypothetical protein CYMTET_51891, partial [Cymbomonas tetramitiformis]